MNGHRPSNEPYWEFPDGRQICSDKEYQKRRESMIERQQERCAICKKMGWRLTFDHEVGRGMGGAKRDDRIENPDGSWKNAALCMGCNGLKGSKPYRWIGGEYIPVAIKEKHER